MDNKNSIVMAEWSAKIKKMLENAGLLFQKIGHSVDEVPSGVFISGKPVSLVFAGQYSAGKSTILKALTNISEIEIGEGITTQMTHTYDWNGIEVIDTPGIHTQLRPDHDEISYHAIANADMLVYVITQELFDDFIGQNFRKLLLDKDKADEMILIVNKMERIGNTLENQEILSKDLEKVTSPYMPSQLRTVFVDAESYLDSLIEDDDEIALELRERSNYETLVETLNAFVRDKAMTARLTTVLYRLFELFQKAIIEHQTTTGDDDIDALEEHLLQERGIILNTQLRIESAVKSIIENTASEIREKGRDIANNIYSFSDEADANDAIKTAYTDVDTLSTSCSESVTNTITELSNNCQAQLDAFYESDFSKTLLFRLEGKLERGNPLISRLLKSDALAQGGKAIVSNTVGANAAANGLKAFTGSNIHKIILDIGHFFGHKFKPWEAVKIVKNIGIAGKVLGVFGVIFSLGMQVKEDVDADKHQQEMRDNRNELRAGFNNAANELVKHFNSALADFLLNNYHSRITEIDLQITEIRNLRIGKTEACRLLECAQADCKYLITDIHKNYSGGVYEALR